MNAGFARARITPPVGTAMMGFSARDRAHGCDGTHDDLFVRALYLTHGTEEALIMGFDLCFLGREDADRCKGAIGRKMDLAPRQILLNTSHTHAGPSVGTWAYADYTPPDRLYLRELERAVVAAASEARACACEVTLRAGATRSSLPMNRRKPDENGRAIFAPNPDGTVCDWLPICLMADARGQPVCLLFSASCHPSTVGGFEVSADYPGVAMELVDSYLGASVSLFLQGAAGDAKPAVIAEGSHHWRGGTWDDVAEAGRMVAEEIIGAFEGGLAQVEPQLHTCAIEVNWPLAPSIGRAGYEALLADAGTEELKRLWAERQLLRLDRGEQLPEAVPLTVHGLQIGKDVRLIGLEGEPVAELGLIIKDFYEGGITFPLGYSDGAQLYLVTSPMLAEGGYEVESYYEYGYPAPAAEGLENILLEALKKLHHQGIR